MPEQSLDPLLGFTVEIVSSYVAHNPLPLTDLSPLIIEVYTTLGRLIKNIPPSAGGHGDIVPAVPVKKSITPDYLVCLEDGKKLKMLKRHLKARYNMTPEAYRERWALPPNYPMVAPNYANRRRSLAKEIGLGRGKRRGAKR